MKVGEIRSLLMVLVQAIAPAKRMEQSKMIAGVELQILDADDQLHLDIGLNCRGMESNINIEK